jgi:hypothetical protein
VAAAFIAAWVGAAATHPAETTAPELARQVTRSADHGHLPFAIVDKQAAMLLAYRADGTLVRARPRCSVGHGVTVLWSASASGRSAVD